MKTYKFIGGLHQCMLLSVNAPNDPGPEYVLEDEANARIAELTAEVASLREALEKIGELAGRYNNTDFLATIARNALKDGV